MPRLYLRESACICGHDRSHSAHGWLCGCGGFPRLRALSTSARSCRVIFSATSALAPWNFAPVLSCVVDQITSPSLFTSRTVAIASCRRSLMLVELLSPTPALSERPLRSSNPDPAPLKCELVPEPELLVDPACMLIPSEDENASVKMRSSAAPCSVTSAR